MLEIISVNPPLPSNREFVMLESFTVSMIIRYASSINELRPQIWTNVITKNNATGKWHALDMNLLQTETDQKTHHFRATCILTGQGHYEFTTRVGLLKEKVSNAGTGETDEEDEDEDDGVECWKWAGGFGVNGRVIVHPPNNKMPWTNGPQAVQISPCVFVGNYIAASNAVELGFSAVLNMSAELEDFYAPEDNVLYKKLGLPDGAQNPIPTEIIQAAVEWIESCVTKGCKVLVHCRAGIGRSGSISIAYLFSHNLNWSFKDTLKAVWKYKPDIYPHQDLELALLKLYPREQLELPSNDSSAMAPEPLSTQ